MNNNKIKMEDSAENIEFEIVRYKAIKFYNETNTPKIIKLIMKLSGGLIKKPKQAEYILFGLVVLVMGISLYLFFGGKQTTTSQLAPIMLSQTEQTQIPTNP